MKNVIVHITYQNDKAVGVLCQSFNVIFSTGPASGHTQSTPRQEGSVLRKK